MNIIIIGAGAVGSVAADTVSKFHDVLVIENDQAKVDAIRNRLNVSVLHEDGTNPRTIEYAVKNHNPDVMISTLARDDSNLFISMMTKRLNRNIRTVPSVRDPVFMSAHGAGTFDDVDVVISPEHTTARKMMGLCILENAVDFERLESLGLCYAMFKIPEGSPVEGKPVVGLGYEGPCNILSIRRGNEIIFEVETQVMHVGDKVSVIGSFEGLQKFNQHIGIDDIARDITILGGSVVGIDLAKMLLNDPRRRYVKIIEKDTQICNQMAKDFTSLVIVNADYTDPEVQATENIFKSDCLVCVSGHDDTNMLICMTAIRRNTRKIVSRSFRKEYMEIFNYSGLDSVIAYDMVVSNEVLKSISPDGSLLMRLGREGEVLFSRVLSEDSKLCGCLMGDVTVPDGLSVAAVIRGGTVIFPRLDTEFRSGDVIVAFTNITKYSELAKVFGKSFSLGI